MTHSEEHFECLLTDDPRKLAALIESGELPAPVLSSAAEILGRCNDGALVRATLRPLLGHEKAYVREGAIYGLQSHINSQVAQWLTIARDGDPSPAVRSAAKEALDG